MKTAIAAMLLATAISSTSLACPYDQLADGEARQAAVREALGINPCSLTATMQSAMDETRLIRKQRELQERKLDADLAELDVRIERARNMR